MADGNIDLASLGVRIDATTVDEFSTKGERFIATGARMEATAEQIGQTSKRSAGALREYATAVQEATLAQGRRSSCGCLNPRRNEEKPQSPR